MDCSHQIRSPVAAHLRRLRALRASFEDSRAVVLPVPFERTTSYVTGTRNAPREILLASGQVELWDEETGTDA